MCLGQKAILSKDAVSLPIHIEIAFGIQNYVKLSNICLYHTNFKFDDSNEKFYITYFFQNGMLELIWTFKYLVPMALRILHSFNLIDIEVHRLIYIYIYIYIPTLWL